MVMGGQLNVKNLKLRKKESCTLLHKMNYLDKLFLVGKTWFHVAVLELSSINIDGGIAVEFTTGLKWYWQRQNSRLGELEANTWLHVSSASFKPFQDG